MIEQINDNTYSIDTAGLGRDEKMHIYMPPCQCGKIKNGIGLNTGNDGWLIDVDDFLAMAEIIKQHQADLEPAPDALPCRTVAQEHCQGGQCSHLRVLFGMGCSGPNRKDKRYACIHPCLDGDLRIIPPLQLGSALWTPGWCPLIESDALPCGHQRPEEGG